MANEGDKIVLNNPGVVTGTPTKWKGIMRDQGYRDISYHNHNQTIDGTLDPWTPGLVLGGYLQGLQRHTGQQRIGYTSQHGQQTTHGYPTTQTT